ncbi:MAG: M43 family zinc metalloprotease [Bacteroidia bacterium]
MKAHLFTLFSILIINVGICQNEPNDCLFNDNISDPVGLDIKGAASCNNYLSYIPGNNLNETPILTFRVNIHIYRDSNGNGVFQPSDIPQFYNQIALVNEHFNNLLPPVLSVSPPAPFIPSSRIQFRLTNVYFHDDSDFYFSDESCGSIFYDTHGINKNTEINIFYYRGTDINPIGVGCGPYPYVNMREHTYLDWASSQLLAHELGHVLGLPHTFSGTCSNCTDDSYDDTFYPDCNRDWLPCGINSIANCNNNPIHTGISNNIMGYNTCRKYFSPKQIGRMHYNAIVFSNRRNYLDCNYDNAQSITISNSHSVWESAKFVRGDIIIQSGSSLSIRCDVYMPPTGKIIVQTGAKLIIDEGRITSSCDNMWQGVMLHGNINQSQQIINGMPVYQGMVEMKNGAIIENAVNGISTMRRDANGNIDWSSFGGIIRASNSSFLNNKRDVEFM